MFFSAWLIIHPVILTGFLLSRSRASQVKDQRTQTRRSGPRSPGKGLHSSSRSNRVPAVPLPWSQHPSADCRLIKKLWFSCAKHVALVFQMPRQIRIITRTLNWRLKEVQQIKSLCSYDNSCGVSSAIFLMGPFFRAVFVLKPQQYYLKNRMKTVRDYLQHFSRNLFQHAITNYSHDSDRWQSSWHHSTLFHFISPPPSWCFRINFAAFKSCCVYVVMYMWSYVHTGLGNVRSRTTSNERSM